MTPRFACLLGPEASVEIARNVFWLLDGPDAQLQDALGTLSHIESIGRFAILEQLDSPVGALRVSARGAVSVGIDGSTTARASGDVLTTDASDVRSAWVSLDGGRPAGELLPLNRGIAHASGLVLDTSAAPDLDAASFAAEAEATPEAAPEATPTAEFAQPEPQPEQQPEAAAEPEAEPAPEAGTGVRWVLRLPDGSEVDADGTIIIGRDEWQSEVEGDLIRHVSVPSPQRQISGDHLELALVGDELVARDLHSTNGTIVITAEQPPRLLHKGDTTALQSGDILDLGESLRIVVATR